MARKLLLGLAALLFSKLAHADFYDGVRGPSKAQLHYTAHLADEKTQHSLALKYFGERIFAVGAVHTDSNTITGEFVGAGYILERFEQVKAIPVIGYALPGNGEQGTLVGIAQATLFLDEGGTFLLDPSYTVALPVQRLANHIPQHTFGATASVGNARVRAGLDADYTLDQKVNERVLFRYDIDAQKHSSWVEFGVNRDGSIQLQFRGNF